MLYKEYINAINKLATQYKEKVDECVKEYEKETIAIQTQVQQMKKEGKYTENYIAEFENSTPSLDGYRAKLEGMRSTASEQIELYLGKIEKSMRGYFNAPVSPEFAMKIQSVSLLGLKLSNAEFKLLEASANTYMERRLLNQLAESRTKTEVSAKLNENGEMEKLHNEIPNAYYGVVVPDMDSVYSQYDRYKGAVYSLLNNYYGENAELRELSNENTPIYVMGNATRFFKQNLTEEMMNTLDKANEMIMPFEKQRKLSESERNLIDAIIDPNYPTLAKDKVKELASLSVDIGNLLSLDERYRDYI